MSFGFWGKILRINLSDGTTQVIAKDEWFYRQYLGGTNIVTDIMLNEIPVHADPLGAENKLIFATSIITGTPIPGSSRFTVAAKSPLTGGFGESQAGGWWGAELKFAGYDALIIEGKAERPVYIYIKDAHVEIKDASHLWGKDTDYVQEKIKSELQDQRVRVLQIGPAGENLVRFAAITNELKHWNGRTGLGAVMGSKNLRAIAVRGSNKPPIKDKEGLLNLVRSIVRRVSVDPALTTKRELGTAENFETLNQLGLLPTKNFNFGVFDEADQLSAEKMKEEILVKNEACFACPVRCKRVVSYQSAELNVDPKFGGPEYETLNSLGANCGVGDLLLVSKANELCARYGLDVISTGQTIAFAMECFENKLIGLEDTDGIELTFGNGKALLAIIERIAKREGFGDILAEGSYRAAERIGKGSKKYTVTVKKQEAPAHEPRGKWGVGLGYAISPTGADHLIAEHDQAFLKDAGCLKIFGLRDPVLETNLDVNKIRTFAHAQLVWSLYNVLNLCIFIIEPEAKAMTIPDLLELVNMVTGWDLSLWELFKAAEKSINLTRIFNLKHGFSAKDDDLPERYFQPLKEGRFDGVAINREEFSRALDLFYQVRGWDEQGIPTYGKLAELGLEQYSIE